MALIIAAALGLGIGFLATGELPSVFRKAPGHGAKTTELTATFDNSNTSEQPGSFTDRLPIPSPSASPAIAPTGPQPTQPNSQSANLPVAPTVAPSANETPAQVVTAEVASEPAPAIRGVTDSEIRFGISAPFTGPAKELGQNMKLGIEAAFDATNAKGGVYGRQLRLFAADDGYDADCNDNAAAL